MPEYSYVCESCSHKWSIVSSFSEYKEKRRCPSCKKTKPVYRDYLVDKMHSSVKLALSEVKTIGHYAEKQTEQYGKWKCEDMRREFKTKKTEGGGDLPSGMSRMETPKESTSWTDSPKKHRSPNKRKKK